MCRLLMLTVIAMLSSQFCLQAVDYDINMSRRAKTGDKYHVTCTVTAAFRFVSTVDEQVHPANQYTMKCNLTADAETVVAGKEGSEVHVRLLINAFSYQIDDGEKKALPAGSVVDVKWDTDKTIYLLNDKPVDETLNRIFSVTFIAEPPTHSPDDRISGTAIKQPVGGKWPVNAEAFADHMTKFGNLPTKAENVTGFMTLDEVKGTELKILTEGSATDVQVKLEPWMTISESKMQFTTEAFFPIDLILRPTKKTYRMTVSATGVGEKDGQKQRLDMVYRYVGDYNMHPLPK